MLDRLQRFLRGNAQPEAPSAERVKVRAAIFDRSRNVVNVVGESFRQTALEQIAGGRGPTGVLDPDHLAGLLPEPTNPIDSEAVSVQIDAVLVGYLNREDARAYRPIIDRLAAHDLHLACPARLTGGWDRGDDDQGGIGVRLHVGTPAALWAEIDEMFGPADPPVPLRAVRARKATVRRGAADEAPVPREWVATAAPSSGAMVQGEWAGRSVCFTGPSGFAFHGEPISRAMQELLAEQHGLVVLPRVTKKLGVLVIGQGDPQTGKRAMADRYGTAVMDEATFWSGLGVTLDRLGG